MADIKEISTSNKRAQHNTFVRENEELCDELNDMITEFENKWNVKLEEVALVFDEDEQTGIISKSIYPLWVFLKRKRKSN